MYYRINNEPVIENFVMTTENGKSLIYYACFVLILILTIIVLWYIGVFSMPSVLKLNSISPTTLPSYSTKSVGSSRSVDNYPSLTRGNSINNSS